MFQISPVSNTFLTKIQSRIDGKTKPLGALGELEHLATKLAAVYCDNADDYVEQIAINKPQLIVFAADHGIASQGISIAPSEVTQQMVANFATGGAAINVFTRELGWDLSVVDAGMLKAADSELNVIDQRLGSGTESFHLQSAMTPEQVQQGMDFARVLVQRLKEQGCNLIAFGEMGIGNTSSASAIMSAITKLKVSECVGTGTGINEQQLKRKEHLITQALALHKPALDNPTQLLASVGGFEIVQICGAMLAAAEAKIPVLVDGFICTAAAMVAKLINPYVEGYLIFAHCSGEQGHQKMLDWFEQKPLLNLGLRLGEGTGAALALPIVKAAVAFYSDMASFADANVENVVE